MEPTNHELIRVLIVDSDLQFGRALVRLLRPIDDIEIIATAVNEKTALDLAVRLHPDIALVDTGAARMDGMQITRALCQQAPTTQVVMLSVYATFRSQAFAVGACGFLLKNCRRDELITAIRLASRGQCQTSGEEGRNQSEDRCKL